MTVGSIVHELLQIVLQRRITTFKEVEAVVEEMLMSQKMAFTLYSSQMSTAEAYEEVNKFKDKIVEFVGKYLTGKVAVQSGKV